MHIDIDIRSQWLRLYDDAGTLIRRYRVSTAKNGAGEQRGSFRTPRGRHVIRARIGARPANCGRPNWRPRIRAATGY